MKNNKKEKNKITKQNIVVMILAFLTSSMSWIANIGELS